MSVILNEGAITRLFEAENGPVGRFVGRISSRVVFQAQLNVRDYFHSAPSLNVDGDIGLSMEGSTAVIGIKDAGNKSRRLARAQAEGKVNWLKDAVGAVSATENS
jgi:hypothetical protein